MITNDPGGRAFFPVESPFGFVEILWREGETPLLERVFLPGGAESAGCGEGSRGAASRIRTLSDLPPPILKIAVFVCGFLAGSGGEFPLEEIPLGTCPAFQAEILRLEHGFKAGTVGSYSWLARAAGRPKAARAAGASLSRNPFPVLVPCHRAIRADGNLGGYQGGLPMKRTLLQREGVPFRPDGKVDPDYIRFLA